MAADDGSLCVRITAGAHSLSSKRQMVNGDDEFLIPLDKLKSVDWTAKGGDGGNGAKGGDGGDGATGSTADNDIEGVGSCSAGRGGQGGQGSHGANGGSGGSVQVHFKEEDTYLAMAVLGSGPNEDISDRLAGGRGGVPGQNGLHGFRGREENQKGSTEREPGDIFMDTTRFEPIAGSNGKQGSFQVAVVGEDDFTKMYDSRYDVSLHRAEANALSNLPKSPDDETSTFEFGETVLIPQVEMKNFGQMTTPRQRIRVGLKESVCRNLKPYPDESVFIRTPIPPGTVGSTTVGAIRFECALPNVGELGEDYDPVTSDGALVLEAFQLGPERKTKKAKVGSVFQHEYTSFDSFGGAKFNLKFPTPFRWSQGRQGQQ